MFCKEAQSQKNVRSRKNRNRATKITQGELFCNPVPSLNSEILLRALLSRLPAFSGAWSPQSATGELTDHASSFLYLHLFTHTHTHTHVPKRKGSGRALNSKNDFVAGVCPCLDPMSGWERIRRRCLLWLRSAACETDPLSTSRKP